RSRRFDSSEGGQGVDFDLAETFDILERTPSGVGALLRGTSPSWHAGNEGPETWSAFDVIGHLIHGEETDWVPRMRIILEHGEAVPFTPFDRVAFRPAPAGHSTSALLQRFAVLRGESLRALGAMRLEAAVLARKGTHPGLGRVTFGQLLAAWGV